METIKKQHTIFELQIKGFTKVELNDHTTTILYRIGKSFIRAYVFAFDDTQVATITINKANPQDNKLAFTDSRGSWMTLQEMTRVIDWITKLTN